MTTADERLQAEQRARVRIDAQLAAAGWLVDDSRELDLFADAPASRSARW